MKRREPRERRKVDGRRGADMPRSNDRGNCVSEEEYRRVIRSLFEANHGEWLRRSVGILSRAGHNHDDACEALQEACCETWHGRVRFDPARPEPGTLEDAFFKWILKMATWRLISAERRTRREVSVAEVPVVIRGVGLRAPDPCEQFRERDDGNWIAVKTVSYFHPETCRDALMRHLAEELTCGEAAAISGTSKATISRRANFFRARRGYLGPPERPSYDVATVKRLRRMGRELVVMLDVEVPEDGDLEPLSRCDVDEGTEVWICEVISGGER